MPERSPCCKSKIFIKYGHTRHGKQNYLCKKCGCQFSEFSENKRITQEAKEKIKKLLLERISLRGICRVMKVSLNWLLSFIVSIYKELPDDLNIQVKTRSDAILFRIESEIDEMWSFVGSKSNKQWIWIALDRETRQVKL